MDDCKEEDSFQKNDPILSYTYTKFQTKRQKDGI